MKTIGVFDAKNRLSELIDSGEVVTITKHGRPVATLSPIRRIQQTSPPESHELVRSRSFSLESLQCE